MFRFIAKLLSGISLVVIFTCATASEQTQVLQPQSPVGPHHYNSWSSHRAITTKARSNVSWDWQQRSLEVGDARLGVGYQMVCGYYDNQAEYASFGLERQIFKCSKIVVPLAWTYHKWQVIFQFAPLYDSIMAKSYTPDDPGVYGKDSEGRNIYGNLYQDWYKNIGTRIYYLGKFPVLEATVDYNFTPGISLKAGRMRQAVGLLDHETPWDDGMFSPYAYWVSRDLLSGVSSIYRVTHLALQAAILSGNNPMKGYANYLDHVQSPNIKANNTVSLALQIGLPLTGWLHMDNSSVVRAGMLLDTMSSTWADTLQDGKRHNNVYAAAWRLAWQLHTAWSLAWFGQYTWYLSGLTTKSGQVNTSPGKPYKDIMQQGVFSGLEVGYKALDLSYTFSIFDRFDANVYAKYYNSDTRQYFRGLSLAQLEAMHQYTHIVNLQYHLNNFFSLQANYLAIDNPLPWVSNILDTKPDYRFNVGLNVDF